VNRVRRWRRRVPLRQQLTTSECAAACLAMIATYHGRDTTVTECRELLGGGRDGVSVRRLLTGANGIGLLPQLGQELPAADAGNPTIAYLRDHHFVVVERAGRHDVRIADPAVGRYQQSRAEFLARYGGLLITLTPQPGAFVARRRRLRELLPVRYLREFVAVPGGRRILGMALLLAAVLKVLGLALPLATQVVVDRLIPRDRVDLLPYLLAAVAATAILVAIVSLVRSLALTTLRAQADTALGHRFIRHLLRLPLSYFLQRARGDLLMRLGSVSSSRELATQQMLTLVLDAALLIGYLLGLAVVAPWYLPLVVLLGGAQALVLARAYPRLGTLTQRELAARTDEQSYLVETLEAVVPVKANGVEPLVERRWAELFGRYRQATILRSRYGARVDAVHQGLLTLAPLALLWLGVALTLDGRMSLGTALAANTVALSVLTPVATLAAVGQLYPMLRSQIERMYDMLDAAEEPTGALRPPATEAAHVQLSTVDFRYTDGAEPVLADISFTAPAGGKLAIVGPTGSGKSTVALLVLGLLRPERGSIRHDGHDLATLDLAALRAGCGAVLQDLNLFNGTIRANIALGRPDLTDADITLAAQTAGLHAEILRLPLGYDTAVGEGGTALSAGQRQRVALARALVHRPRLLILDEATSHLDPETERRVDAALSRLDVTRIVISHRVGAVRTADQILVLEHGRIVARGRHEELARTDPVYRRLFADVAIPVGEADGASEPDPRADRLEALSA
jgi:ABC-type bacteriocin/lantibiotic exporter with double-glycine peptidase domain